MSDVTGEEYKEELKFVSDTLMLLPESGLTSWSYRSSFWLVRLARTNILPRVIPKKWRDSFSTPPRLIDIAKALGLSSIEFEQHLRGHQKRLSKRLGAYLLIVIPLLILLFLIPFIMVLIFFQTKGLSTILLYPFFLVFAVPIELILIRATLVLLDKDYADSLCVQASLGVLVELARPHVLNDSSQKRYLLVYINEVARYALLLPLCFRSSSEAANASIRNHFHRIEQFIRAQEVMAIIPESNTLRDLQSNFLKLTQLFNSGKYGDFEWQGEEEKVQSTVEVPLKWHQNFASWAGKIVGLGIPLVGLYFTFAEPTAIAGLPIDEKTVTLIALAWMFLSIDSIFQLGITAKIVTTAKEIKDLI